MRIHKKRLVLPLNYVKVCSTSCSKCSLRGSNSRLFVNKTNILTTELSERIPYWKGTDLHKWNLSIDYSVTQPNLSLATATTIIYTSSLSSNYSKLVNPYIFLSLSTLFVKSHETKSRACNNSNHHPLVRVSRNPLRIVSCVNWSLYVWGFHWINL